jgi:hypothetical protein
VSASTASGVATQTPTQTILDEMMQPASIRDPETLVCNSIILALQRLHNFLL